MNRAIRRVGIGVTVLVLLLVGQLTYLQVYDADRLANDPRNIRFQLRDFSKPRGRIVTADGQIVARSVETGGELKFQRLYPLGPLLSPATSPSSSATSASSARTTTCSQDGTRC
jgi:penicillin-binding protein A